MAANGLPANASGEAEKTALFSQTATDVYRLDLPS